MTLGARAPGTDRRALLILNPRAARGGGTGLETKLRAAAQACGWEAEVRTTTRAGQETEFAAAARRDEWPVVVAVGGDGTVHGVANGLLAGGDPAVLGHVPIGTGNDFAKLLGLRPGNVEANLRRVLDGEVRRFDVGRALDEFFINGMGIGFGAEVVRQALRMDHLSGFALYLAAVYRSFWAFEPIGLRVTSVEHREDAKMTMMEISLGVSAGGGFRLTPDAKPDDGLFDVCIIRKVSTFQFLRYVPRVVRGTHGGLPPVHLFQTASLAVTSDRPMAVHFDGELRLPDDQEVTVELLPGRLPVLCAR
ncbi:MAG TPA: diacylglycerol kinase family protein [Gemmatimonadales bacterium]|jgi:YegS/Rv2252/BmrU family lipid kinase